MKKKLRIAGIREAAIEVSLLWWITQWTMGHHFSVFYCHCPPISTWINRYICNTTHYQILGPLASNEATEATDATEGLPPVPPTADNVETYAEESQVFAIVFFVVLAVIWALFTHACILVTCRSTLQILWPGASCDRCDFFHDMFGSWLIFLIRLHFLNHGRLSFSAFSLLTDFFCQSRHLFFPYVRPPLWHP